MAVGHVIVLGGLKSHTNVGAQVRKRAGLRTLIFKQCSALVSERDNMGGDEAGK